MFANSVYCCQRSVSRISAAARKRRMAASLSVIESAGCFLELLFPFWLPLSLASAALTGINDAPTARLLMKERRPIFLADGVAAPGIFSEVVWLSPVLAWFVERRDMFFVFM